MSILNFDPDPDEDEYEVQQGRFDTGVHIPSRRVPE